MQEGPTVHGDSPWPPDAPRLRYRPRVQGDPMLWFVPGASGLDALRHALGELESGLPGLPPQGGDLGLSRHDDLDMRLAPMDPFQRAPVIDSYMFWLCARGDLLLGELRWRTAPLPEATRLLQSYPQQDAAIREFIRDAPKCDESEGKVDQLTSGVLRMADLLRRQIGDRWALGGGCSGIRPRAGIRRFRSTPSTSTWKGASACRETKSIVTPCSTFTSGPHAGRWSTAGGESYATLATLELSTPAGYGKP